MSDDVDDVAALCIANALMDRGEVDLLAVLHDTGLLDGVGAISRINHYYGRDWVPIGAYTGSFLKALPGPYVEDLDARFKGPIHDYTQAGRAVEVYRRALSAQPDRSVTIVSVGFATNLADLLRSGADDLSPLSGTALVAAKVRSVVWMGGKYPTSHGSGPEFNFGHGGPKDAFGKQTAAATSAALGLLPSTVDIVFTGFEVGSQIQSGSKLATCQPPGNPCRQAFIDYVGAGNSRCSWDPSAVLLGAYGANPAWYSVEGKGGENAIDASTGDNAWVFPSRRPLNQSYVVLRGPAAAQAIGQQIDDLLCTPAGSREIHT